MRSRLAFAALVTIAVALTLIFAMVVRDAGQQEAQLQVHFPISCGAESQRLFDSATARLHSLRYVEAERTYTTISELEPDCAMAYWGVAMSRLKRPIAVTPLPDDLRTARDAVRVASTARVATTRERAYLAAVELLIGDGDVGGWRERTISYEGAMAELTARQPNDREAVIFYALALNMAAIPSDKTFRKQTKAAELLLVALSEQPDHPGLSHYLTYCLNLPSASISDVPATLKTRAASSMQTALAILALVGVAAFFVSVLPVWSGRVDLRKSGSQVD